MVILILAHASKSHEYVTLGKEKVHYWGNGDPSSLLNHWYMKDPMIRWDPDTAETDYFEQEELAAAQC